MDSSDVLTIEEQQDVVSRLHRLTVDKVTSWRLAKGEDGVFLLSMGDHTYILRSRDGDGLLPYELEIRISETNEVLATIVTKAVDDRNYNEFLAEQLRDVYENAYRYSHRSEKKITSLLSELERIDRGDLPPF